VEVSALKPPVALRGPTPFLRLQSDERLVELTRRGNQAAYEALVARYQSRLQSFCRHMLGSKEDAEDVLQEVFAAAFSAMTADDRPLNVRPWLYRIARNRSLNHLRRARAVGVDSMDVHFAEGGITTADKVQRREDLRLLFGDVQDLAETQRTALLLREIDALSYDQIAEAMETTVPAIKSLLVRARMSLAEAAEARALTCDEVRLELGEVAEGLKRMSPPVRRHLKGCERCTAFHQHLRTNNKALAAIFPVAPLLMLKKLLLAHVGGAGNAATAGGASAGAAAATTGGSVAAGGALSAGVGAVATKAAAGLAAVAIVGAGAVEVHNTHPLPHKSTAVALAPKPVVTAPHVFLSVGQPSVAAHAPVVHHHHLLPHHAAHKLSRAVHVDEPVVTTPVETTPPPVPVDTTPTTTAPAPAPPQTESDATNLPSGSSGGSGSTTTIETPTTTTPPVETTPPPVPVDTTPVTPPTDTTPAPPDDTTPVTPPTDTTPAPAPPPVDTTPTTPTTPTPPPVGP